MRYLLRVFLLCLSVAAQGQSPVAQASSAGSGLFYINGIVYRYAAGTDYTVVAAAHSALNHKFVAVKLRVYNLGQQSVTVKPEDVRVEDAIAGQTLAPILAPELARRMRRPYNWARLAVNPVAGEPDEAPSVSNVNPQILEMMRAMGARASAAGAPVLSGSRAILYTDTPGALPSHGPIPSPADCGTVCRLRNREAAGPDVLAQLQRQTSPDYVEQSAFLANTITPQSDADGILYFPLPKLSRGASSVPAGKKAGMVRVTVTVGNERFQFDLLVE